MEQKHKHSQRIIRMWSSYNVLLFYWHGNRPVFAYQCKHKSLSFTASFVIAMPKVTHYTRNRIDCLLKEGFPPVKILKVLRGEGLEASLASVTRIIQKLRTTGSTENRS